MIAIILKMSKHFVTDDRFIDAWLMSRDPVTSWPLRVASKVANPSRYCPCAVYLSYH